jgi:hypothetical protein
MMGVMGILAGEDRINYREERVVPSVLPPAKILNYLNEIGAGRFGFFA